MELVSAEMFPAFRKFADTPNISNVPSQSIRSIVSILLGPLQGFSTYMQQIDSKHCWIVLIKIVYWKYLEVVVSLNIPAEGKPRERFDWLLPGESQSPVIYNIKWSSDQFGKLNLGLKKSGCKIYWFLTNPGKHHVHQTWMRRFFFTLFVGSAITEISAA